MNANPEASLTPFRDVESWARAYVQSTDLAYKLAPSPLPPHHQESPVAERLAAPGRPAVLRPATRRSRAPKPEALHDKRLRAQLMHAFFHHELQAAELMCWAVLAFPDTPAAFRRGLLRICHDEIRHMNMYRAHIEALGHRLGDFPVRDWFWRRVPSCQDARAFVALMGMGFEGGNLDLAPTYAERFRVVGDEEGARIQEQVGAEERAHVRFAVHWFSTWTGGCDFETWSKLLPPPLSPAMMRGRSVARDERLAAGMPPAFIDALCAYVAEAHGRPLPEAPSLPRP